MNESILSQLVLQNICNINRVHLRKGAFFQRTHRPQSAFSLKLSGKTIFTHNHKEYLSDSAHLIFLPKGADYSFTCVEEGECIIVDFDTLLPPDPQALFSFPISNTADILRLLERLEHTVHFSGRNQFPLCMSLLYELISKVILQQTNYQTHSKEALIKKSIAYLEKHFTDADLNSTLLAEISGISDSYFRRIFTGVYGISPKKYINLTRIRRAKELLFDSSYSMKAVAEASGFTDLYHFCKVFKLSTGYTPREFAKMQKEYLL